MHGYKILLNCKFWKKVVIIQLKQFRYDKMTCFSDYCDERFVFKKAGTYLMS